MKKNLILVALLAVGVMAFGVVDSAYAQGGTPNPCGGNGPRDGSGPLHDLMEANLADQLGISLEEFEARREAGETAYQIALDLGFSPDEAWALINAAHTATINQAAEQGLITSEQASWMLSHSRGNGPGLGVGNCDGTGRQNQGNQVRGGNQR
ncbi:MAG: hypothetical protein WD751_07945 [Anaerolineales bacterium]